MNEKSRFIIIRMELAIPAHLETKEEIADYLNTMLYDDPEFFGDFGEENVVEISEEVW